MRNYISLIESAMRQPVKAATKAPVRKLTESPDDDEPKVVWSAFDEPEVKPTATKDKAPDLGIGMADPTSRGQVAARNANGGISGRGAAGGGAGARARAQRADLGPVADAETTRRSMRAGDNAEASATYMDQLSRSGIQSEISDEEAARRVGLGGRPNPQDRIGGAQQNRLAGPQGRNVAVPGNEPHTIENLPAVMNREIARNGDGALANPQWHMVRNLPGYMRNVIRGIGEQIFRPFTDTPLDQIQVMSSLSNPMEDVQNLMGYIAANGRRADECEMEFDQIMPGAMEIADNLNGNNLGGYKARVQIWELAGYQFMMVRDHAGVYVYAYVGRDQQDIGHDGGPAGLIGN